MSGEDAFLWALLWLAFVLAVAAAGLLDKALAAGFRALSDRRAGVPGNEEVKPCPTDSPTTRRSCSPDGSWH